MFLSPIFSLLLCKMVVVVGGGGGGVIIQNFISLESRLHGILELSCATPT